MWTWPASTQLNQTNPPAVLLVSLSSSLLCGLSGDLLRAGEAGGGHDVQFVWRLHQRKEGAGEENTALCCWYCWISNNLNRVDISYFDLYRKFDISFRYIESSIFHISIYRKFDTSYSDILKVRYFVFRCIERFDAISHTNKILHRTRSFGIRSGRHAHAPGSSSASYCCCNGSVGLNWHTARHVSDTWKCGSLTHIFTHPPEENKKQKNNPSCSWPERAGR